MLLSVGATGLVGGAVVNQLSAHGVAVRALVRSPAKVATLTAPGVATVLGDLAQPASLAQALEGVTRALLISPHHPLFFMQNLLRSAAEVATSGSLAAARQDGRIAMVDARAVAAVAVAALTESGLPDWLINVRVEFAAVLRPNYAATVTNTVETVTGQPPRTFIAFAREHTTLFRGSQT